MSWWVWVLIAWCGVATVCAVWLGLALANADRRDRLRQQEERDQREAA